MNANDAKGTYGFGRLTLNAVIVSLFGALLYLGIRLFLDRQWAVSFLPVALALTLIPFADHSSSLRERVGVSLIMPFALGGLALFVVVYFQMFHFHWFEAIFNDKGSGEFGLVVSAFLGIAVGGYLGYRIVRLSGIFANATNEKGSGVFSS
jgi:hypothetical protein